MAGAASPPRTSHSRCARSRSRPGRANRAAHSRSMVCRPSQPGGHAHVDECHAVEGGPSASASARGRAPRLPGPGRPSRSRSSGRAAVAGTVSPNRSAPRRMSSAPPSAELLAARGQQNLAKVLMDRRIVVDDQDALALLAVLEFVGFCTGVLGSLPCPAGSIGSSEVSKLAPRPGPSLSTRAAFRRSSLRGQRPGVQAEAVSRRSCRESVREQARARCSSLGMPTPLSMTEIRTPSMEQAPDPGAGGGSLSGRPDSSQAYFALRTRFTRICNTLCLSTVIRGRDLREFALERDPMAHERACIEAQAVLHELGRPPRSRRRRRAWRSSAAWPRFP